MTAHKTNRQFLFTTGTDVPDPNKIGSVESAMNQAHQLIDYLRLNNWPSDIKVPLELRRLPEQKYDEIPGNRDEHEPSFILYDPTLNLATPEVAFVSKTFYRRNVSRYKEDIGETTTSRPSGFFIVGYRDGRIEKIAPSAVRMIADPNQPQAAVETFPGCQSYRDDLPHLPNLDNSEDNQRKMRLQFAQAGAAAATYEARFRKANNYRGPWKAACANCKL